MAPEGTILFSVPFARNSKRSIIRARLSADGTVEYLLKPEYHADPMNDEGCLCYQHFGWEMLDALLHTGFRDAYAMLYWSRECCYLGGEQILFKAVKVL